MRRLIAMRKGPFRALFLGRHVARETPPERALTEATEHLGWATPEAVSFTKQVHSARVVEAASGHGQEADGLYTNEPMRALCVVTADCVPVLAAAQDAVAALHAGWRGLAQGILGEGLRALEAPSTAWIGPCMAGCCYEVGGDVAVQVAAASGTSCVVAQPGEARPTLALAHAAAAQLARAGLEDVRHASVCTGCAPDEWWSYRRSGPKSGRNLSFIWRRASSER